MTPIAHTTHEVPLRWADLDSMRHVNNVRFLDIAIAAEVSADPSTGRSAPFTPRHVVVDYARPVTNVHQSLVVQNHAHAAIAEQRIYEAHGSHLELCATVTTAALPTAEPDPSGAWPFQTTIALRDSDVGRDGHVGRAACFELAQEARIGLLRDLLDSGAGGDFVIAHVELDLVSPLTGDTASHPVACAVTHIGQRSLVVATSVGYGAIRARAVNVAFDAAAGTSRQLTADEISYFEKRRAIAS